MIDATPVLETDLDAYIDNQLDAAGRLRVEMWLSRHPDAAARVMADISLRTTLKLALSSPSTHARPETREAGRRLSSGLAGQRMWNAVRRIAAVGILFAAGWFANSSGGLLSPREVNASVHPPAFVMQAIQAHRTSAVRKAMPSQPEAAEFDRAEIRAATAIEIPEFPQEWRISDVQVFPSPFGPSIDMGLETADGTHMSLFAVRPGYFAVEAVSELAVSNAVVAWWQIGEVAYAVVSDAKDTELADEAELLMNTLH